MIKNTIATKVITIVVTALCVSGASMHATVGNHAPEREHAVTLTSEWVDTNPFNDYRDVSKTVQFESGRKGKVVDYQKSINDTLSWWGQTSETSKIDLHHKINEETSTHQEMSVYGTITLIHINRVVCVIELKETGYLKHSASLEGDYALPITITFPGLDNTQKLNGTLRYKGPIDNIGGLPDDAIVSADLFQASQPNKKAYKLALNKHFQMTFYRYESDQKTLTKINAPTVLEPESQIPYNLSEYTNLTQRENIKNRLDKYVAQFYDHTNSVVRNQKDALVQGVHRLYKGLTIKISPIDFDSEDHDYRQGYAYKETIEGETGERIGIYMGEESLTGLPCLAPKYSKNGYEHPIPREISVLSHELMHVYIDMLFENETLSALVPDVPAEYQALTVKETDEKMWNILQGIYDKYRIDDEHSLFLPYPVEYMKNRGELFPILYTLLTDLKDTESGMMGAKYKEGSENEHKEVRPFLSYQAFITKVETSTVLSEEEKVAIKEVYGVAKQIIDWFLGT